MQQHSLQQELALARHVAARSALCRPCNVRRPGRDGMSSPRPRQAEACFIRTARVLELVTKPSGSLGNSVFVWYAVSAAHRLLHLRCCGLATQGIGTLQHEQFKLRA